MKNLDARYRKRFLTILFTILGIFSIIVFLIIFGYKILRAEPAYDPSKQRDSTLITEKETKQQEEQKVNGIFKPPVRTNILITVTDEEGIRTDGIMVASFVSTTGKINVLSIPRDTYVTFKGEELKALRKANPRAPSIMKATEINAYAREQGIEMLKLFIEKEFNIKIDYYVKMNFKAFRNLIDSVGGIEFDVPQRMKYSDPTQDLYINLQPGLQILDGDKAEQLLRFRKDNYNRGYARGDLQRIEVQQQFLKAFVEQVLSRENIISNIDKIAINLIKYVDTDFSLTDLPRYLSCIPNLSVDKVTTAMLPGYAQKINDISYYIVEYDKAREIIDEFFYGNTDPEKETESTTLQGENESITTTTLQ